MRTSSMSVVTSTAPPPITHRIAPRARRTPIEVALTKFASDLSPAKGQKFFDLLVAFVADCLGFEMVIVGELAADGTSRFTPIAEYPPSSETTRAVVGTHCDRLAATGCSTRSERIEGGSIDVPLVGSDGRAIGVICGIGHAGLADAGMSRMLFRII